MQEKFYKYLSFLWPIRLESRSSSVSGRLEISWEYGKKVLNGPNSNYSFGSLEKVFERALKYFHFSPQPSDDILILGYGGGSLGRIFKKRKYCYASCRAVELDPVVIEIVHQHFREHLGKTELIEGEAGHFLNGTEAQYDYIFLDLFEDDTVPPQFLEQPFIKLLQQRLKPGGRVYHNVMLCKNQEDQLLNRYRAQFEVVNYMRTFERNLVIEAKSGLKAG